MKTTESILDDLTRRREECLASGDLVELQRLDQECIAHRTLERLRGERARLADAGDAVAAAGLDAQIRYWRSTVDVDAEVILAEGRPELVDPPTETAKPARRRV